MAPNHTMYFGTRGHMQMVPTCAISPDFSKTNWNAIDRYLNGGAGGRGSSGAAKGYALSWPNASYDDIDIITDFAEGVYDDSDGTNLIYFNDPMVIRRNALPQIWATPSQAHNDGMTLVQNQVPGVLQTPANTLKYPARSATYNANFSSDQIWIPIPPGYVAWVGFHGSKTGNAGFTVNPTQGPIELSTVTPALLSVTTTTRFNASFAGTDCDGIMIRMIDDGPDSTARLTSSGNMVQILRVGETPQTGAFISGKGNSGCVFDGHPTDVPLSNKLGDGGRGAVTAKLVEIGSWL